MAATSAATATHSLFRNLLLLGPLRLSTAVTTTSSFSLLRPNLSFSPLSTHSLFSSSSATAPLRSAAVSTPLCSDSAPQLVSEPAVEERENEIEEEQEEEEKVNGEILAVVEELAKREMPVLSLQEKMDLTSHAHSLGDKLKSQQVGKSGVTNNVIFALSETLESRELLKLKIQKSCGAEMDDVVRHLERATASVAISKIGRSVIFYRPSLTKLEAEKKKEQNRKLFAQRKKRAQSTFSKQEQFPRRPGRYQPRSRRERGSS